MADAENLSNYVALTPPQTLVFKQVVRDGRSQVDNRVFLIVSNKHSVKNLAFKVKTTVPSAYQVRPFQGIVGAGQDFQVEIILIPQEVSIPSSPRVDLRYRPAQVPGASSFYRP